MKLAGYGLVLMLSVTSSGCFLDRKKVSAPPPPPLPAKAPPRTADVPLPPDNGLNKPIAPAGATTQIPVPPLPPDEKGTKATSPTPTRQRRATVRPPQTPPAAAVPVPVPATLPPDVTPAPTPVPQLVEVLTPGARRQSEVELVVSLQRARTALGRAAGRNLTPAQRDTVERIRVFIQQAEAERSKDIATALQLARRANLLGEDLVKSLPQFE